MRPFKYLVIMLIIGLLAAACTSAATPLHDCAAIDLGTDNRASTDLSPSTGTRRAETHGICGGIADRCLQRNWRAVQAAESRRDV